MKSFKIKSKDTEYNGYRFRSRLEARWANFFDRMGIKFVYEPQTFVLENGTLYIPDFYLPDLNAFAEVKFEKLNSRDFKKAFLLVKEGPQKLLILDGDPSPTKFTLMEKDDNDPLGFKLGYFNLILDDKKENFIDSPYVVNRETCRERGYLRELQAIDKARKNRFGVYE